jgi:hypothetical protein
LKVSTNNLIYHRTAEIELPSNPCANKPNDAGGAETIAQKNTAIDLCTICNQRILYTPYQLQAYHLRAYQIRANAAQIALNPRAMKQDGAGRCEPFIQIDAPIDLGTTRIKCMLRFHCQLRAGAVQIALDSRVLQTDHAREFAQAERERAMHCDSVSFNVTSYLATPKEDRLSLCELKINAKQILGTYLLEDAPNEVER